MLSTLKNLLIPKWLRNLLNPKDAGWLASPKNKKLFPVLKAGRIAARRATGLATPSHIAWSLVEPFRALVQASYRQSLERIAERGGFGIEEFYMLYHGLNEAPYPLTKIHVEWFLNWVKK